MIYNIKLYFLYNFALIMLKLKYLNRYLYYIYNGRQSKITITKYD